MRAKNLLLAAVLTLSACSTRMANNPALTSNIPTVSQPVLATTSQTSFYSLPNHALTPGEILTTDRATICQPGYTATVRHTTLAMKQQVEREYGYTSNPGEIDHLIALELGGADTVANLWAQSRGQYQVKDALENLLHSRVCSGSIQIQDAQQCMRDDWVACARRFRVIS